MPRIFPRLSNWRLSEKSRRHVLLQWMLLFLRRATCRATLILNGPSQSISRQSPPTLTQEAWIGGMAGRWAKGWDAAGDDEDLFVDVLGIVALGNP